MKNLWIIKTTLPRKFDEEFKKKITGSWKNLTEKICGRFEKKFTDHRNNFTEKNLMVKSDDTYDSVPKILGKLIEGTTVK